jgi:hypothetical protein
MAVVATSAFHESGSDGLPPSAAMRRAWIAWLIMLVVPFLLFVVAVWYATWIREGGSSHTTLNQVWFIIAMIYLIVVVPASLFWRSHIFKAYWQGNTVSPRNYLHGMISVWVALEIGGLFSHVGCIVGGSLVPCLLPALIAFMFYILMWPNGHAMSHTTGGTDDPALYEEPR